MRVAITEIFKRNNMEVSKNADRKVAETNSKENVSSETL